MPVKPLLTIDVTMEILRTTVPKLRDLTRGVSQAWLSTVTDYGWSVHEQLAHLRAAHDVLGGNMLRIVREDHPAWKGAPVWRNQTGYSEWKFHDSFEGFRAQRSELLEALDPLSPEAWAQTATVSVPPGKVYEYSVLYYGDWMARHERSHLKHMARVLADVAATASGGRTKT
jgi:hypothetical protein